jgi:hypothetical protein
MKVDHPMATFSCILTGIGKFLYHVSPSLVGVIAGGVFVQWYWVSRANESTLINYFSEELTDLTDETLEYWSLEYKGDTKKDDESRQRAKVLEQRIKGSIKNLNSALGQYSRKYCNKTNFQPLVQEVQDACTGGTFEEATREADHSRYLSVVNTTHRLRWKLFERRV